MRQQVKVGDTLTCAETGKQFVVKSTGISFNYAYDSQDRIFSDEGVDIREKREMLDRTKPFGCYLSSGGQYVTGWKGNILGVVTRSSTSRTGFYNSSLTHIRVRDVHGNHWHGKGAGPGMYITLHPAKKA
jgi:hypothetical protein